MKKIYTTLCNNKFSIAKNLIFTAKDRETLDITFDKVLPKIQQKMCCKSMIITYHTLYYDILFSKSFLTNDFDLNKIIKKCSAFNSNMILIFPEPETFLHPSFQVEFVENLRKLQKHLYFKIFITTHSVYVLKAFETYFKDKDSEYYYITQENNKPVFTNYSKDKQFLFKKFYEPFQKLEEDSYLYKEHLEYIKNHTKKDKRFYI